MAIESLNGIYTSKANDLRRKVIIFYLNNGNYDRARYLYVNTFENGNVIINYDYNGGSRDYNAWVIGDHFYYPKSKKLGYTFSNYKVKSYSISNHKLIIELEAIYIRNN